LKGTGILDGRATPLAEHADSLNEARERASFKARALGWPNYFELDTGENFSDATTDSIYVLEVKTEFVAQPLERYSLDYGSRDFGLAGPRPPIDSGMIIAALS
jgi:hypothetical protein